jgi:hypothetical protein
VRIVLFALLCAASSLACAQVPTLSPNAPKDKPQAITANHVGAYKAAIAPYIAEAKKTYPAAKARFLRGLPSGERFYVTTLLHDQFGKVEQVFVSVQSIKNSVVTGRISSPINMVAGYKLGEAYSFPESQVIDWLITHTDGSEEGNYVGKFLDTYHSSGT